MTVKEGGSNSAPANPNDEAVERVKADLKRADDKPWPFSTLRTEDLRHLLSRYERMEKALEPFALADNLNQKLPPKDRLDVMRRTICAEHFRAARQALGASE